MNRKRESFTLIEMLVVIAVIAILAGIAFKMIQIAKRNADRAATIAKLEKVAHALNEYKAEYGIYPPVSPGVCKVHSGCSVCYQYENTNAQPAWLCQNYLVDNPGGANLFDMGLVSYLVARDKGAIYHTDAPEWVGDSGRDKAAKERWGVFMEGVTATYGVTNWVQGTPYGNVYDTIQDSWLNVIKYESDPPYLSYRLWSKGPDGADGTADDLHRDKWDN
jgi:prepilin-type N-terminal cleavage/methylation domain-containing protein